MFFRYTNDPEQPSQGAERPGSHDVRGTSVLRRPFVKRRPEWNCDFEPVISESESGMLPLHQRAIAGLSGVRNT